MNWRHCSLPPCPLQVSSKPLTGYRRSLIERETPRQLHFAIGNAGVCDSGPDYEGSQEIQQRRLDKLISIVWNWLMQRIYPADQERLFVSPLLATFQHVYPGRAEMEEQLLSLFDQLRQIYRLCSGLWTSKPDCTIANAAWELSVWISRISPFAGHICRVSRCKMRHSLDL